MTDAATMQPRMGVPVIVVGPGEIALAHQTDEWVSVENLYLAARFYSAIACTV